MDRGTRGRSRGRGRGGESTAEGAGNATDRVQSADAPRQQHRRPVSAEAGGAQSARPTTGEPQNQNQVVKVGSETNVRSFAGHLAMKARESFYPTVAAVGPLSTNQAVKGIAIARSYLEENNIDLGFVPKFVHLDTGLSSGLELQIVSAVAADSTSKATLKVSGSTDVKKLAGAIARSARDGLVVELSCIGPSSVNQGVKSVAVARSYLAEEAIDLLCMPRFVHIDFQEEGRSSSRSSVSIYVYKKTV